MSVKNLFRIVVPVMVACLMTMVSFASSKKVINRNYYSYTDTSRDAAPFGNFYNYSTSQMIYTKSELGTNMTSGNITSLAFYVQQPSAFAGQEVTVYMGTTSLSSFSSTSDAFSSTNLTQVFSGTITLGANKEWEEIFFDKSFYYNGSSNIVVMVTRKTSSSYNGGLYYALYNEKNNMCLYRRADGSTTYCDGTNMSNYTLTTHRPVIRFSYSTPTFTDGYYLIDDALELKWLARKVNTGSTTYNAKINSAFSVPQALFEPIGTSSNPYSGTFEGQNYKIYFENTPTTSYNGLFGYIGTSGTVSKVYVSGDYDCTFSGLNYVGGICAYNKGTIKNCSVCRLKVEGNYYVGGICGYNGGTVSECYVNYDSYGGYSSISGMNYVGGISGINEGEIKKCSVLDERCVISATGTVGGICGSNGGEISNCCNKAVVEGSSIIGGICGYSKNSISYSYNTAAVSGSSSVGGVVGSMKGSVNSVYNNGSVTASGQRVGGLVGEGTDAFTIQNSYNTGTVTGQSLVGALAGSSSVTGEIDNCYYVEGFAVDGSSTMQNAVGNATAGYTTADKNPMKKANGQFVGGEVCWLLNGSTDAGTTWYQTIGSDAYPVLDNTRRPVYRIDETQYYSNEPKEIPAAHEELLASLEGEGTPESPYLIPDYVSLVSFRCIVDSGYTMACGKLTADIVMNESVLDANGNLRSDYRSAGLKTWTPFAKNVNYMGVFDGNGYTVSGMYIQSSDPYSALFSQINGATLKNVSLTDSYVKGGVAGSSLICGYAKNAVLSDCMTDGCLIGGDLGVSGCICAMAENCSFTNCTNNANIINGGMAIGGIAGETSNCSISRCVNNGTIDLPSGSSMVGGIVGYSYQGNLNVDKCYNTGSILAVSSVAGIVGTATGNSPTIANCYNTGTITATSGTVSGIATNIEFGYISNCFSVGVLNGASVGAVLSTNYSSYPSVVENCYYNSGNGTYKAVYGSEDNVANNVKSKTVVELCSSLPASFSSDVWNVGTTENASENVVSQDGMLGEKILGTYISLKNVGEAQLAKISYFNIATIENPEWTTNFFTIYNMDDLSNVKNNLSANYVLMKDIQESDNFTNGVLKEIPEVEWQPLGVFKGNFYGNNHSISGLYVNSNNSYVGLFSQIDGSVTNLTIKDSYISSSNSNAYVGAFAGYVYNGTVKYCHNVNTTVVSQKYAGGIIGVAYKNPYYCSNSGDITSVQYAGGIVGMGMVEVMQSYNTGTIKSGNSAGGICGDGGAINCYNLGSVSAPYAGGIAGNATLSSVKNCYNGGVISGANTPSGITNLSLGTIQNNYYQEGTADGGISGGDSEGSGEVRSADELCLSLQNEFSEDVWGLKEPVVSTKDAKKYLYYPYLKCFGEESATVGSIRKINKVILNPNGGTCEDVTSYIEREGVALPIEVTREGYTFNGWYTNVSCTSDEIFEVSTDAVGDQVFYAKWTANEYNVNLDPDGGKISFGDVISYTYGTYTVLPNDVTKTGYTFKGWFPVTECSLYLESYDASSKVSVVKLIRDLTNLGLGDAVDLLNSAPVLLKSNMDIKSANDWKEKFASNGAVTTIEGGQISQGLQTSDVTLQSIDASQKIAAIKVVRKYTGLGLGEAKTIVESAPVVIMTNAELSICEALKVELEEIGAEVSYSNLIANQSKVAILPTDEGDIRLLAKWEPKEYFVNLEVNGGLNTKNVEGYVYGETVVLPTTDEISRQGYTFDGWYKNSNFDGEPITEITSADYGDKSFYAKWIVDMYDVTLDVNGGKINSGNIITYTYDVLAILPVDVTRLGYTFEGWYDADDNKVMYVERGTIGDVTYTAKWSPVNYEITLYTNGGTIPQGAATNYVYGSKTSLPNDVQLDGYTFKGWYSNSYYEGLPVTEILETEYGNKQYWARWTKNCQILVDGTITDASCYGLSDGKISLTLDNAVEPLTYQWLEIDSLTASVSGLTAGNYSVVVTDSRECSVTKTFTVSQPEEMIVTVAEVINPRCDAISEIKLDANGDYTYLWSNGSTEKDLIGAEIGTYTVTVKNPENGCTVSLSQELEMSIQQPEISLVTVSKETGHNLIVWIREATDQIDYYTIYRETSETGTWDPIGTVDYNEISVFEDEEADAMDRQWSYKISATDNCGNETEMSKAHTTIHVNEPKSLRPGYADLSWNYYEGLDYKSFYIIRETKVSGYTFIDTLTTVPSNVDMYSAELPSVGKSLYYVGIKLNDVINPKEFLKAESGPFSLAFSNIAEAENKTAINGISESDVEVYAIEKTIFVKNAEGKDVTIYDNNGRCMLQKNDAEAENEFSVRLSGVYFVKVGNVSFKVIVK